MVNFKLLGKQGKNPNIWYDVDGYITTLTELARIFNINHNTLRQRLRYDWDIAPACLVGSTLKLSFKEVTMLTMDPTIEDQFKSALRKHFDRPSSSSFGG
jgi:hypothetical protein